MTFRLLRSVTLLFGLLLVCSRPAGPRDLSSPPFVATCDFRSQARVTSGGNVLASTAELHAECGDIPSAAALVLANPYPTYVPLTLKSAWPYGDQAGRATGAVPAVTGIAAEGDWPMAAANPERSSWTPEEVRGELDPVWYRPIEPYIPPRVQIIAANDLLYISTARGLYALDAATGADAWVYPTALPLGHSPTVYDNVAYVGGFDKKIHAVDALTGQGLWTFDGAEAGFQTNPLVVNGVIYMGNRDGYMYAVGAHGTLNQGQLIWRYETQDPILFSAAYKDDTIYFASNDSHAYALNAQTGQLVWQSGKLPGSGFHSWWPVVHTDPNTQQDYVLLAGSNNYRHFLGPLYGPDLQQREMDDIYGDIPVGGTIDSACVFEYFEQKPWRRTYFVLRADTGEEVTFDYDDDGNPEYAPFLWFGTHSGNRYPSTSFPGGSIYEPTHYIKQNPYIGWGGIVEWHVGENPVNALGHINAMDEPIAFSGGGGLIYWNRCNDRTGGAFDINSGESWRYFRYNLDTFIPGYNVLYDVLDPDDYSKNSLFRGPSGSRNGVYGQHGDQNPPVPYKGRVYMHRSNSIIAFGDYQGQPTSLPMAETREVEGADNPVGTNQLKQELTAEIQKVLAAGHLRPGYTSTGLFDGYTKHQGGDNLIDYWHYPSDVLYVLTCALPHLSEDLKDEVQTYLQSEYANYPPYQYTHSGYRDGVARESFDLPYEVEAARADHGPAVRGFGFDGWTWPPQMFYHLWKYAQAVGGAQQIFDDNSYRLESPPSDEYLLDYPYVHNAYVAGYLGYLNLEELAGYPESYNIRVELDRLLDLRATSFSKDTPFVGDDYEANRHFNRALSVARNFMFLVPELGQYLHDNALADVQEAVEEYSEIAPYWFVSNFEVIHFEGATQHLYDHYALFQAKALVLKEPREELVKYLDVPAVEVGDLFYIQNLVAAIEAPHDLEKTAAPPFAYQGSPVTYTLSFFGSGSTLILTDTLPLGVSAPDSFELEGTSVTPTYDGSQHRLTWSDASPAGHEVTIRYVVAISTSDCQALVNSAELSEAGGEPSNATTTVIANPQLIYLPLVLRED